MTKISNNIHISEHVKDVVNSHSSSMYKFRLLNLLFAIDVVSYSQLMHLQDRLYWDNILGTLDII